MILKLMIHNEAVDEQNPYGWKFLDGVIRTNVYSTTERPEKPLGTAGCLITQKENVPIRGGKILDCEMQDKGEYMVYTELDAFLLNDKGETVERLN